MNIRKIIGLGLLAAFVGCQDQPAKECAYHPKVDSSSGPGLGSAIVVKVGDKPKPNKGECEQKHKWTSEKGEPH